MKPFYFTKENWKLKWNFQDLKDWLYVVTQPKSIRSVQQNRLYWWWFLKHLVKFHEDKWDIYTSDQLHWVFKTMLLKKRKYNEVWNKRKWITEVWSTSDLNTKQFTEYMDKINKIYIDAHWFSVPECPNEEELLYWEKMIV